MYHNSYNSSYNFTHQNRNRPFHINSFSHHPFNRYLHKKDFYQQQQNVERDLTDYRQQKLQNYLGRTKSFHKLGQCPVSTQLTGSQFYKREYFDFREKIPQRSKNVYSNNDKKCMPQKVSSLTHLKTQRNEFRPNPRNRLDILLAKKAEIDQRAQLIIQGIKPKQSKSPQFNHEQKLFELNSRPVKQRFQYPERVRQKDEGRCYRKQIEQRDKLFDENISPRKGIMDDLVLLSKAGSQMLRR